MKITGVYPRGTVMATRANGDEIDGIAWKFLCSPFTRRDYWDWPLERRIDAFLRHLKRLDILNDGAAYDALIDRVMANFPRARRDGVLDPPRR
jgi:hypothetical protein